jgi:hypothetical protein
MIRFVRCSTALEAEAGSTRWAAAISAAQTSRSARFMLANSASPIGPRHQPWDQGLSIHAQIASYLFANHMP